MRVRRVAKPPAVPRPPVRTKFEAGSRRSRLDAVPVKVRRTGHPPRAKGIYHVGWTDYPDPTYP